MIWLSPISSHIAVLAALYAATDSIAAYYLYITLTRVYHSLLPALRTFHQLPRATMAPRLIFRAYDIISRATPAIISMLFGLLYEDSRVMSAAF